MKQKLLLNTIWIFKWIYGKEEINFVLLTGQKSAKMKVLEKWQIQ